MFALSFNIVFLSPTQGYRLATIPRIPLYYPTIKISLEIGMLPPLTAIEKQHPALNNHRRIVPF